MHDPVTFEARLRAALEQYADGAPTDVEPLTYARAIAATGRRRQDRSVGFGLRRGQPSPVVARLGFVLATALLVVALIGTALIVGGQLVERGPDPVPSVLPPPSIQRSPSVSDLFAAPFEYHLPRDGSLSRVPTVSSFTMVGFVEGPVTVPPGAFPDTEPYRTNTEPYGTRFQGPDGAPRGIVVVRVSDAMTHSCPPGPPAPARPQLGDSPAEILEGLRTTAGAGIASDPSVVIDGRPALVATVMPTEHLCEGPTATDIHTTFSDYVSLGHPSRLIVLQVDDETILIDIWARSDEDLADWMPSAMQFVETIHFR